MPPKGSRRPNRAQPTKLPRFEDLVREVAEGKSTKLRDSLTVPQLAEYIDQLKSLVSGLGGSRVADNPADFALSLSGGEWHDARHLRFLSDHIHRLERRDIRFMTVSMPPRHGKSYLLDIWTPLWWLARHPRDRVILAGYGESFARDWGGKVRDLVNEYSDQLNLTLSKDKLAADDWALTAGGGMVCVGVGGALVGRGADLLIIDDPIKNDQEANSETYRQRMWDWFQASAFTRLQPNGVAIVIATRWHMDDLIGRIQTNFTNWTNISIPAIAEKNDLLGRAEGATLWPEHFVDDPDYKIRQGSMSPYWWAAQYQQRPSPEGGGIIKEAWFQFYDEADTQTILNEADQIIQSWDPALLDKKTSDYWAGLVLARKGADIFVIALSRGHYNLAQVTGIIRTWALKYPKATAKLMENTAMGPAVKQTLQHEVPGIIPISAKGTKRSRIEAAIPALMAGNIHLPQNKLGVKPKWVWDLIAEACAYDKGANDDQIDALAQGINFMSPGGWREARKAARETVEEKSLPEMRTDSFKAYAQRVLARATRRFNHQSLRRPLA